MRNAFITAVIVGSALATHVTEAEAAPRAKAGKVKTVSYTEPTAQPVNQCAQDASRRVRADVIIDLESGEKIYSSLSDEDLNGKPLHPASLTKLEGVKEIIRRVEAGIWTRDKTFSVPARPGERALTRNLADIARMSLVTSFNVMDKLAKQDPSFVANIRAYTKRIGMTGTEYYSPTGDPNEDFPDVRKKHVTTASNLLISIRDYYLHYATPEKLQDVFGVPRVSGLPSISDIKGLPRDTSTLTLLQNAIGKKAHPVPGVSDGKTGYTCAAGWSEYLKYDFNGRSFIFLTLGHDSPAERQTQALKLLENQKPALISYSEKAQAAMVAATPAPISVTPVVHTPSPDAPMPTYIPD